MIRQIRTNLGDGRLRALFGLLAVTGLLSAVFNVAVDESDWAQDAQTVLVIVWIVGSVGIILSALDGYTRGRWMGILIPAGGAVILGLLFPDFLGLTVGLAVGWIIAGGLVFRPRSPEEYRNAIKHLRKSRYKEAVDEMSELIKRQPDEPAHYRFRAELFRVWGKLDRARRDYRKMADLAPEMAVAWNGLAEVDLQAGDYAAAHQSALKALELAPDEWVSAYNLGMIEDRLGESDAALTHLQMALDAKVPDSRHRLLIYLYMARAYARLGQTDAAEDALGKVRKHGGGLNEWQIILESDQAETLRDVIAEDIAQVEAIVNGDLSAEGLA